MKFLAENFVAYICTCTIQCKFNRTKACKTTTVWRISYQDNTKTISSCMLGNKKKTSTAF